jgi:SAM-dependent methyltransferase
MQEIVYHSNFEIESSYWWFVARNNILLNSINQLCNISKNDYVLDVGCGTGGFAEQISKESNVICVDTSKTALDYCQRRGLKNLVNSTLEDFEKINTENIKLITMLDVVEHIDDDKSVIESAYRICADKGILLVTVPAYQWLWSHHDEMHMHKRRYTKTQVSDLISNAGFKIQYSTYFNSFLFLPGLLKRFVENITGTKKDTPVDKVSPFMNSIFTKLFSYEGHFLPRTTFPFGMSILIIAKKIKI